MTFYTSIIILTELMMIAMALHVLFYSGFQKNQKTWYLFTFIAIMVCAAAEFAVHCGKYDPAYKIPLTIVTVLQFSLAPMLGIFFSGALSLRKTDGSCARYPSPRRARMNTGRRVRSCPRNSTLPSFGLTRPTIM